jgi:hypothetical protein
VGLGAVHGHDHGLAERGEQRAQALLARIADRVEAQLDEIRERRLAQRLARELLEFGGEVRDDDGQGRPR